MVEAEGVRVVPWADWSEWLALKEMLSNGETEQAYERVAMYRLRRRNAVPIAVITSVALRKQLEKPDPDPYLQRLALSMTLTRFVNGTTDRLQPRGEGSSARSVYSLATELRLPLILVEIRHQASHNELPKLSTLRSAARQALGWLEEYYWEPQSRSIMGVERNGLSAARILIEKTCCFDADMQSGVQGTQKIREATCRPLQDSDTLEKMKQITAGLDKKKRQKGDPHEEETPGRRWSLCGDADAWKTTPLGLIPGQFEVPRLWKRQRQGNKIATQRQVRETSGEEDGHCAIGTESFDGRKPSCQWDAQSYGILSQDEEAYVAKMAAEFRQLAEHAAEGRINTDK